MTVMMFCGRIKNNYKVIRIFQLKIVYPNISTTDYLFTAQFPQM